MDIDVIALLNSKETTERAIAKLKLEREQRQARVDEEQKYINIYLGREKPDHTNEGVIIRGRRYRSFEYKDSLKIIAEETKKIEAIDKAIERLQKRNIYI